MNPKPLVLCALSGIIISLWSLIPNAMAFRARDPVTPSAPFAALVAGDAGALPTDRQRAALQQIPDLQVAWDRQTGAPASLRSPALGQVRIGGQGLKLQGRGRYAMDAIAVLDCLSDIFRLTDARQEFASDRVDADPLGFHHVRLFQRHQGLRVIGAELLVHFNAQGAAYQVNGRYIPGLTNAIAPGIGAAEALARAQADLKQRGHPQWSVTGMPELVVYALESAPQLAYALTLSCHDPRVGRRLWRYWVNAHTGTIIRAYNDVRTLSQTPKAWNAATLSGNLLWGEGGSVVSVPGHYSTRAGEIRYWLEHVDVTNQRSLWVVGNADNTGAYIDSDSAAFRLSPDWTDTDRAEISAGYNFQLTTQYFLDQFGRVGYDGTHPANVNVHMYGDVNNAYWDPDQQAFYFFDGDGIEFNGLTVLDVCAHEFTHAVTEKTSDLIYLNEPGALNEAFSDIFAALVEFAAQPDGRGAYPAHAEGQSDWLIGEDGMVSADGLRDMQNPRRYDQPSRYRGTRWYSGSQDNGGVHINSGVLNFIFYLLCDGGSGNNDGIDYSVAGIGRSAAANIAYRALTVYCTRTTDYRAVRQAFKSAAADLQSIQGTTRSAWADAVDQAFAAGGVEGPRAMRQVVNDYDGDGRSDYALYDYINGLWAIWSSHSGSWLANGTTFGAAGYLPVPGSDYSGDGLADVVVYSRTCGGWDLYYTDSHTTQAYSWGGPQLIPVPGDYDGDGKTDFALYNYDDGTWYIYSSRSGTWLTYGTLFGGFGFLPLSGDFNGGGTTDVAVYSENTGYWYVYFTENGQVAALSWGGPGFMPAPADYDGDGTTDYALYQYGSGAWYILSSRSGGWLSYGGQFGGPTYFPVAGDFNGGGMADIAVYSRTTGNWHILFMETGQTTAFNGGGAAYVPPVLWWLYWYL